MLKWLLKFITIASITFSLSGCLLVAAGTGAAGGYYFNQHYKIEKRHKR